MAGSGHSDSWVARHPPSWRLGSLLRPPKSPQSCRGRAAGVLALVSARAARPAHSCGGPATRGRVLCAGRSLGIPRCTLQLLPRPRACWLPPLEPGSASSRAEACTPSAPRPGCFQPVTPQAPGQCLLALGTCSGLLRGLTAPTAWLVHECHAGEHLPPTRPGLSSFSSLNPRGTSRG